MDEKFKTIEDLGWDDFFESARFRFGEDNLKPVRIIAENRGMYKVKDGQGEYLARVTGKQIFKAESREDFPAVGDWVLVSVSDFGEMTIRYILPRKTIIKRKVGVRNEIKIIAANIDVGFVVESVNRDFSLNRIERYFSLLKNENIKPVIVINKIDLISEEELDLKLKLIKERFAGVEIILSSSLNSIGIKEMRDLIVGGWTYCFLGSSGVGKSTLINCLLDEKRIITQEISTHSDRGKHTTTKREMYFLKNGGIVIDTPGIREVGMADTNRGIEDVFFEISNLAQRCKFIDCTHLHEPGCAVLGAVADGSLDKDKYANFVSLKKETEHYELSNFKKREKDRKFGKVIKKIKKDFKNSNFKYFGK